MFHFGDKKEASHQALAAERRGLIDARHGRGGRSDANAHGQAHQVRRPGSVRYFRPIASCAIVDGRKSVPPHVVGHLALLRHDGIYLKLNDQRGRRLAMTITSVNEYGDGAIEAPGLQRTQTQSAGAIIAQFLLAREGANQQGAGRRVKRHGGDAHGRHLGCSR
jgi:hypothetical protein